MRHYLICLLLATTAYLIAQQAPVSPAQLQQQAEARQADIDSRQALRGFVPNDGVPHLAPADHQTISETEAARCLPIRTVALDGERSKEFVAYLKQALENMALQPRRENTTQFAVSRAGQPACLHAAAMEQLGQETQNAIIDAGWITTRVLFAEQDLNDGTLTLTVLPGYTGDKRFAEDTAEQYLPNLYSTIPGKSRQLLSLRDIEQGLENLRRLPNAQANIDIVPGKSRGQSDLLVHWQQSRWYRFNFTVDDSGSQATGKYLGTLGFAIDNPLRLADNLAFNYSRNVSPGKRQSSPSGHSGRGRTDNYSANYSLPIGYWEVDLKASRYYYDQAVAGQTLTYHYQGASTQAHANIRRTLFRSARNKLEASAGFWQKTNKSYVDSHL